MARNWKKLFIRLAKFSRREPSSLTPTMVDASLHQSLQNHSSNRHVPSEPRVSIHRHLVRMSSMTRSASSMAAYCCFMPSRLHLEISMVPPCLPDFIFSAPILFLCPKGGTPSTHIGITEAFRRC